MKATVTLIVPCYNEEESLPIFYNAVCDVARQLPDYGISLLLVNDGSKDGTLKVMRELAARDERVPVSFLLAELRKGSRHVRRILQREGATMWPSWTPTCRIRRPCCRKCSKLWKPANTTAWPPAALPATASRRSAPFFARMFYKLINRISEADIVDGARAIFA